MFLFSNTFAGVKKDSYFVSYFMFLGDIMDSCGRAIGDIFERMYGLDVGEIGLLRPSVWACFLGCRPVGGYI